MLDRAGDVGRVARENRDDPIRRGFAFGLRPAIRAIVGIILRENRENVFAWRRERRIRRRLEKAFDQRLLALAVRSSIFVGLLQVFYRWRDVNRGAMMRLRMAVRTGGKVRQL